jgi:hypothetical protein
MAPYRLPWSVMANAGNLAAAMDLMNSDGLPFSSVKRVAPSNKLYSVWLCK